MPSDPTCKKGRPHRGFRDMRQEKTRDGCNDDENIRWPRPQDRRCRFPEYQTGVGEAEDNAGMKRRDKHGEQEGQRIDPELHTQRVVRSGNFLPHTDGAAWIGRFSTTRRTLEFGIELFGIFLAQKDRGRRANEREREKNATSTVNHAGKIRPTVGREFCRHHHFNKREEDEH